jgi:eukaryotic-like serine/threonine-protein kinase
MSDETRADDAPLVVAIDVRPGTLFHGRYEIQGVLGRGGMGMVYKAHDRRLDEIVAIKVLRPDFASDPKMAERFRSEIKLARKVRHRNVCTIHDYGEDRGLLYISMELIEGVDLKHRLKEHGAVPTEEAYGIAVQVAQGLQAVHDAGIVHRDLKTPNIMLDAAGTARLMDFGIAKRVGEGTATATGQIVGTPEYMSPEQAQGHKVDYRSDLYALGVVVYEIFTGQVPFRGETPISTILKHLNDPPNLEVAALPQTLRAVLKRCLAKDPALRYASALEIAEALRQARSPSLRQQPVSTDVLQAPTRVMPAVSERRGARILLVVGGVAAALALAAVVGFRLLGGGAVSPSPSVGPREVLVSPVASAIPSTPLPDPEPSVAPASPMASPGRQTPEPTRSPVPSPRPTLRPQMARAATPSPQVAAAVAPPATLPAAAPTPPPFTAPPEPGLLQIAVKPWGEVSVDGRVVGTTPLDRLSLPSGSHRVRVRHPGFPSWERDVVVKPGETTKVMVDLPKEAARQ